MIYENLKEKQLKALVNRDFFDIFLEALSSMFVRSGLPEELDERWIESVLLLNGCGAYCIDEKSGLWSFLAAELAGEPDPYGLGKDVIVHGRDGYVKEFKDWRTNPNVGVCFNNHLKLPDNNIAYYSNLLTEIDTSLRLNILGARVFNVPAISDEKQRTVIKQLYDDMLSGKFGGSITSTNILDDVMGGDKGIPMVSLTDATLSEKIQYLAKIREDLIRWFWNLYGQNSNANGKMAQQTVEEISSGDSIAMIIPHARYHERQREAEMLLAKFGWNVEIEFSEPWQNSFADCGAEEGADELAVELVDEVADDSGREEEAFDENEKE